MKKLLNIITILILSTFLTIETNSQEKFDTIPVNKESVDKKEKEDDFKTTIKLTPNPVKDNLRIEYHLKKRSNVKIVLFNSYGKQLRKLESKNKAIGKHIEYLLINYLSKGLYIAHIQINEKLIIKKFMKF
jgi:hypothetical protein